VSVTNQREGFGTGDRFESVVFRLLSPCQSTENEDRDGCEKDWSESGVYR
jgi:hypothetical protein